MEKIITKLYKFFLVKYMQIKEKTFFAYDTRIKYLFYGEKYKNSNVLIIVFSAFNKEKAMYNYVRSLNEYKVPRLYIKDDFGPRKTGSYYLGEKGKNNVEPAVIALIKKTIENTFGKDVSPKLIFVGSSKGGYAALNFAVEFDNSYAIIGAPQYKLGDHLNEEYFYPMLKDIIGSLSPENIKLLNNHIRDKYLKKNDRYRQKIYIQYSEVEWSDVFKEFTYQKHIKYLIDDIKTLTNIDLECEIMDYRDHNDVHLFYPRFLKEKIESILEEKDD